MNKIEMDNYTKGILTIIALCLFLLTLQQFNLFPKTYANGANNQPLIPNANYGLVPLNEDGSINVRLMANDELDVNITGIDTYDELEVKLMSINTSDELDVNITGIETSDELDVNIDEVGGAYLSHNGPIPVEIK